MSSNNINVLIVDDSAVIRSIFTKTLESNRQINIIAKAGNGQLAIDLLTNHKHEIDVITVDLEMPVMNGITAIPKLLEVSPNVKIIVASTLSKKNAAITLEAFRLGASDFITKPSSMKDEKSADKFKRELLQKVINLGNSPLNSNHTTSPGAQTSIATKIQAEQTNTTKTQQNTFNALAIGSSTGGPQALSTIFKNLKAHKLNIPIFITQHMPAQFTAMLATQLNDYTGMDAHEAVDGEIIKPGTIYLAPGDFHMIIEQKKLQNIIKLTQDPPENFCRPAVDPMLRSLYKTYKNKLLTIILTGMGSDGCKESSKIAKQGGRIIAQNEQSSVVWGMPGAVAKEGICSDILDIEDIAPKILQLIPNQVV